MDPKLFLKRLSEVSEWHRPQLGPNGQPAVRKGHQPQPIEHPGEITEEELDSMTDWEIKCYYDRLMAWRESQPNHTVPPEILKVKPQPKNCEDCGRYCENGRRVERKLHQTGSRHWRSRCLNCDMYQHPSTGAYEVPYKGSHQFFNEYYRPRLGRGPRGPYKKTLDRQQLIQQIQQAKQSIVQPSRVEENTEQIIRYFEQKKS